MNKHTWLYTATSIVATIILLGVANASHGAERRVPSNEHPIPDLIRPLGTQLATGTTTRATTGTATTPTFVPTIITNTPTRTPSAVPSTSTPTMGTTSNPTAVPCFTYSFTYATCESIVPGTQDIGNHCEDCATDIPLPFPFALYEFRGLVGERSNSISPDGWAIMRASSKGWATFLPFYVREDHADSDPNACLPAPGYVYTIFAHWDDLRTDCVGCGIFTSTSGTAPNRIFNVEWRTAYNLGGGTANFEVRLYEDQTRFDIVYGIVSQGGSGATVGVQRDEFSQYTQVLCNTSGISQGLMLTFVRQTCGSPTPTPTGSPVTPTPTATFPTCNLYTPTPTPTLCPLQFSDVPTNYTFYPYIRCLACRGIVNGYPDNTFRPNNNVTRGQLSKIISNAAGFHEPQTTQMFQDVPVGSTFHVYIGRLASRGYIGGYPCGGLGEPCVPPANLPYFRPNNNATRGQISKIDANAAGFSDTPSGQQFEDMAAGSTYYTYTYRLVSRSIIAGYPCGGVGEPCNPPGNLPYFRPNNNATRGQTSKIVANTFFPDCQTPGR
jgi:hypothetical protein